MKILISGAGVAGLTAAHWLSLYGHEVEVVERSINFNSNRGYVIIFSGAGLDVAEKMGLRSEIEKHDNNVKNLNLFNMHGKQAARVSIVDFRKLYNNKVHFLLRGDLIKILYGKVKDAQIVRAGSEIVAVENLHDAVNVHFISGEIKKYDLLIGADGAYSKIREMVFGNEKQFVHDLGYQFKVFLKSISDKDPANFYLYSVPKRQKACYPLKNNQEIAFYIAKNKLVESDLFEDSQLAINSFEDKLIQVRMPSWHRGRVVLLGDSCQCLSLMSGQGASMAMIGAYVLASKLHLHRTNYSVAFQEYQDWIKPHVDRTQRSAQRFIRTFVPNTSMGIFFRNMLTKALDFPFIPNFIFKGLHRNKVRLPC